MVKKITNLVSINLYNFLIKIDIDIAVFIYNSEINKLCPSYIIILFVIIIILNIYAKL